MKILVTKGFRFPLIPLKDAEQARKDFYTLMMEGAFEHYSKDGFKEDQYILVNPESGSCDKIDAIPEGSEVVDVTEEDIFPKPLDPVFQGSVNLKNIFLSQLTDEAQKAAVEASELGEGNTFLYLMSDGQFTIITTNKPDGAEEAEQAARYVRLTNWRNEWLEAAEKVLLAQKEANQAKTEA